MGLTAEVENAANSSLMSELWFGRMDGVRNAVLLTVSEGIGVGILAEGKLITGHYGTAGEFGHIPIDSSGPLCSCGQVGCWETLASTKAAQRYYVQRAPTAEGVSYREHPNKALEGIGVSVPGRVNAQGLRLVLRRICIGRISISRSFVFSTDSFESGARARVHCQLHEANPRLSSSALETGWQERTIYRRTSRLILRPISFDPRTTSDRSICLIIRTGSFVDPETTSAIEGVSIDGDFPNGFMHRSCSQNGKLRIAN